ncbi:serine hydrolase [Streptomyces sp. enrichment culture]|uniref:serine hydrolase n=1 Tax=Streptomyces sp. enrichment culture TaxID=1795815 RepID=UPI003F565D89
MTHQRRARVVAATLGAGLLIPLAASPADAATATVSCTSAQAGLATKLQRDIQAAVNARSGSIAVGVYDRSTKTICTLRPTVRHNSASVVKVTVLGALLYETQRLGRGLTSEEMSLARAMITKSDNASTSTLWNRLGRTKIQRFLDAAGMTHTVLGPGGTWGITEITVTDEQKLLKMLTASSSTVLTDARRAYALKLMREVVSTQFWGTPYGAPSTVTKAVKNGWLQRTTDYRWRVHSIGAFKGNGHDYFITVLTTNANGNSMQYGVNTIQSIAKVVHRDLHAS